LRGRNRGTKKGEEKNKMKLKKKLTRINWPSPFDVLIIAHVGEPGIPNFSVF
jgi:hypothetical protein